MTATVRWEKVPGAGPTMPVAVITAPAPGPAAVITANLHGDECTGIAAISRLCQALPDLLLQGSVHLYPSLNPEGLQQGLRGLPGVDRDPNRAFPGRSGGDGAERHAWRVWRDILSRAPAFLIDLHTDSGAAIPYAIVDRVVRGRKASVLSERCQQLAEASGLTVLREYPREQYLRYQLDRSLPGALINELGTPAVTLEVGPRGYVERGAMTAAAEATLGVLTAAGLVDRPASPHPTRQGGGPWRRASGPPITAEGVLVPAALPGQRVMSGELLATIRQLDGAVAQRMLAPEEAFIVAFPERAWVHPGQSSATLAVRDD